MLGITGGSRRACGHARALVRSGGARLENMPKPNEHHGRAARRTEVGVIHEVLQHQASDHAVFVALVSGTARLLLLRGLSGRLRLLRLLCWRIIVLIVNLLWHRHFWCYNLPLALGGGAGGRGGLLHWVTGRLPLIRLLCQWIMIPILHLLRNRHFWCYKLPLALGGRAVPG